MSYKLFTDKPTLFECKLELDGASLKETVARLVIEGETHDIMFVGRVTAEGVCEIPVGKLKGVLDEHTTGTMRLEVIAEDTYFQPWSSGFVVESSRKLAVEVKTQAPSRPALRVEVRTLDAKTLTNNIVAELRKKGITGESVPRKKATILESISTHLSNANYDGDRKTIIENVVKQLAQ